MELLALLMKNYNFLIVKIGLHATLSDKGSIDKGSIFPRSPYGQGVAISSLNHTNFVTCVCGRKNALFMSPCVCLEGVLGLDRNGPCMHFVQSCVCFQVIISDEYGILHFELCIVLFLREKTTSKIHCQERIQPHRPMGIGIGIGK